MFIGHVTYKLVDVEVKSRVFVAFYAELSDLSVTFLCLFAVWGYLVSET